MVYAIVAAELSTNDFANPQIKVRWEFISSNLWSSILIDQLRKNPYLNHNVKSILGVEGPFYNAK